MGCYIWYSEEGTGRAAAPPSPLLGVPNVSAHPSTTSVPITVLLYDGPLLCDFNVAIKGLILQQFGKAVTCIVVKLSGLIGNSIAWYHAVKFARWLHPAAGAGRGLLSMAALAAFRHTQRYC